MRYLFMNNINPVPGDQEDQNIDANKQYQAILDKYAQEIKNAPPEPAENPVSPVTQGTPAVSETPITPIEQPKVQEPVLSLETPPPQLVLNENIEVDENENEAEVLTPVTNPPVVEAAPAPVVESAPISTPAVETIPEPEPVIEPTPAPQPEPAFKSDLPPISDFVPPVEPPTPKASPIPKIFFIFSLILFLCVASALAYTNFSSKPVTNLTKTSTPEITSTPSTAVQTGAGCDLNDKHYNEGQNFVASDGCNACSCTNGSITCTSRTCLATVSAKSTKTVTPTASSSAKTLTPTNTATNSSQTTY